MSLEGKIAVVTGASRGIGHAIALTLAKHGASVVVTYTSSSSEEPTKALVAEIQKLGRKALAVRADVGKMEDIDHLVKATIDKFPRVDILVNNAGALIGGSLGEYKLEDYNHMFDVNVRGPFFLTQALLPYLNDKGRIINLSSVSARLGMAGQALYASTKAALESATRNWASELRENRLHATLLILGQFRLICSTT